MQVCRFATGQVRAADENSWHLSWRTRQWRVNFVGFKHVWLWCLLVVVLRKDTCRYQCSLLPCPPSPSQPEPVTLTWMDWRQYEECRIVLFLHKNIWYQNHFQDAQNSPHYPCNHVITTPPVWIQPETFLLFTVYYKNIQRQLAFTLWHV